MSEIPAEVRTAIDGLRSLGGDALRRQMLDVFVEHSRGRVDALAAAAAAGDLVAAAAAAHSLKGSARQLGLQALGDASFAVEQAAKAGDLAAMQTQTAVVHEAYTTAVDWLRQLTA